MCHVRMESFTSIATLWGGGGISDWPILQSEDRTVSCSRINIVWGSASSLLVLRLIYAVYQTHIFCAKSYSCADINCLHVRSNSTVVSWSVVHVEAGKKEAGALHFPEITVWRAFMSLCMTADPVPLCISDEHDGCDFHSQQLPPVV